MTATEWDAFWILRLHPDAQPEFQTLAGIMKELYDSSKSKPGRFHLPYTDDVPDMDLELALKVSGARSARVSYRTFDGKTSNPEVDIDLCSDLIKSGHLSPFDHQAISDTAHYDPVKGKKFWNNPADHRQFWGWVPYRVEIEERLGWKGQRRNSYDPLP